MKKFLITLLLSLAPSLGWAQCNGVAPPATYCGNSTASPNVPAMTPAVNILTSTSTSTAPMLNLTQSVSGTGIPTNTTTIYPNTTAYSSNIITAHVPIGLSTPNNWLNGLSILQDYGGTNVNGNAQALYVQGDFFATTSNTNGNYVAGTFVQAVGANDAGNGGSFFGLNPVAIAFAAATAINELAGMEINVGALAGSGVQGKGGLTIVQLSNDAVHGSLWDDAIRIQGQVGSVGWNNFIEAVSADGATVFFKVDGSGNLVSTNSLNSSVSHQINNSNAGASAQALFAATTNAGQILFAGNSTAGSSISVLRWTGAGTFFIDAQNATGNFSFRTGVTPTAALNISAAGVLQVPLIATGTPVAAACFDASNNLIKKVGTSC